jgi:hypothetical protein
MGMNRISRNKSFYCIRDIESGLFYITQKSLTDSLKESLHFQSAKEAFTWVDNYELESTMVEYYLYRESYTLIRKCCPDSLDNDSESISDEEFKND